MRNHIFQLGLIFTFSIAGDFFVRLVPGGLPGTVMGMLFMLFALVVKLLKPKHIQECAGFLSNNMAFFFLPAMASLLVNSSLIMPVFWQLVFIAAFSTFLTFFAAYGTVRILRILLNKRTQ